MIAAALAHALRNYESWPNVALVPSFTAEGSGVAVVARW